MPRIGVGEVRFGMKRDKVAAILGPDIAAEPWMGGNLNDALLYPGIILYFDKCDSHGPSARGRLIQVEANASFPGRLFGRRLSMLTRQDILSDPAMLGQPVREFPNQSMEVAGLNAHFWFRPDDSLDVVSIHCGDIVTSDAWNGWRCFRSFWQRLFTATEIQCTCLLIAQQAAPGNRRVTSVSSLALRAGGA